MKRLITVMSHLKTASNTAFSLCPLSTVTRPSDSKADTLSGNVERFMGFADVYAKARSAPPAALRDILPRLAQCSGKVNLLVDIGSGTGLSTRFWSNDAINVIGVEPSDDMRNYAISETKSKNVTYRKGFSHQTGLESGSADIVTCSQSLHWMNPLTTFPEIKRILRTGGIFAAYDADWPPTILWPIDKAFDDLMTVVHKVNDEGGYTDKAGHKSWDKFTHLSRMQSSGCFRFTREFLLHNVEEGDAERYLLLVESLGEVQALLKRGVSKDKMGWAKFAEDVKKGFGGKKLPWYFCYRVRMGVV